jgi:general secretion pathway protein D
MISFNARSRRYIGAARLGPLLSAAMLAGCAQAVDITPDAVVPLPSGVAPAGAPPRTAAQTDPSSGPVLLSPGSQAARTVAAPEVIRGTGTFVNPGAAATYRAEPTVTGNDVTLNFAGVDVRDVLKAVLGDLLHLSYTVDPAIQGTVTLQTGRPIPRAAVINVLASALQLSGAGLVQRDGLYVVVPVANAGRQAPIGGTSGFVTQVVTPQFVSAVDIERVLEPLVPPGTTIKSDAARNVLIVSGTARDVATVMDNVATFDVDALRGASFALMPLKNGRARDIAAEITTLIASTSKMMADTVKVVPIERMNAVIVTSMQPAYLSRVQGWVDRLDRGGGRADQQLFVYRVQNGRAADIARVLRRALGIETDSGGGAGPPPMAAAGPVGPVTGLATPTQIDTLLAKPGGAPADGGAPPARPPGPPGPPGSEPLASVPAAAAFASGGRPAPMSEIRVTPDEVNNALIITGSAQDYAPIEAALQKLDIAPLQVLIEATIAEVTLGNQLQFGLQHFFQSGNFRDLFALAPTGLNTAPFLGFTLTPGVNFSYLGGSAANVVVQALSGITDVRVLSSPNLLVRNNGSARLQVGDQVPIATQSATSTLTNTAQTVNSIDYRDTGIILNVTPRVNASGLVLLDISEEASVPKNSLTTAGLNSPTISQRRVTSTVAVNDGQTIGLAGLIQERDESSRSGYPILSDLPVVGALFGVRNKRAERVELIVLITPRVMRGRDDADEITRELREKVRMTIPISARRR